MKKVEASEFMKESFLSGKVTKDSFIFHVAFYSYGILAKDIIGKQDTVEYKEIIKYINTIKRKKPRGKKNG